MSHFVAVPATYLVQELLPKSLTNGNEAAIIKTVSTGMRILFALGVYLVGAWLSGFLRDRRQDGDLKGKKDRDDDDVSTNVDSSDHSSNSDTDDDEFTGCHRSSPKSRLVRLPTKTGCVIDSTTFLRLRPAKGRSPPGYLHTAVVEEKPEPAKPTQRKTSGSDRRWESLRNDDWQTVRGSESPVHAAKGVAGAGIPLGLMDDQKSAPWRKSSGGSTGSLTGSLTGSNGGLRPSWSVEKSTPPSLSSGLGGTTSLRPQRKL